MLQCIFLLSDSGWLVRKSYNGTVIISWMSSLIRSGWTLKSVEQRKKAPKPKADGEPDSNSGEEKTTASSSKSEFHVMLGLVIYDHNKDRRYLWCKKTLWKKGVNLGTSNQFSRQNNRSAKMFFIGSGWLLKVSGNCKRGIWRSITYSFMHPLP